MKDLLFLNYDIIIDKIYYKDNEKCFFVNNYKINILEVNKDDLEHITKLISLTNNLYNTITVNTFILNNRDSFFTKYNNKYIILYKNNNIGNVFCLNDIYKFWSINNNLDNYDILDEWVKEVDQIEEKLIMFNMEFKTVQNSANYYIGMAENAIQLLNDYRNSINNYNDSIGHKLSYRLFDNNDLYNPFTFIKTNKMYDISNYIKYSFFQNTIDYNEIELLFRNGTDYENLFLFCNLMYPSVYFDLIKNVFLEKESETKIDSIIKNRKKYIKLLSFCKKIVKSNKNIKLINWFN
jgi:hypothetical protein